MAALATVYEMLASDTWQLYLANEHVQGDEIGYDISEDCLALNIVRPSGYEGQWLPVGVWIHGKPAILS